MKHHLKHMVVGGGLLLAVLLVLKVDLRSALTYAALLACPLGMVGMMVMMNRRGHGGHEHHHESTGEAPDSGTAEGLPPTVQRSAHR
jgi:hypothetical protein